MLGDDADAVVDAGATLSVFLRARLMRRPKDWICAIRGDRIATSMDSGSRVRSGFAKSIGREWNECFARVVHTHPDLTWRHRFVIVEELAPMGRLIYWNASVVMQWSCSWLPTHSRVRHLPIK